MPNWKFRQFTAQGKIKRTRQAIHPSRQFLIRNPSVQTWIHHTDDPSTAPIATCQRRIGRDLPRVQTDTGRNWKISVTTRDLRRATRVLDARAAHVQIGDTSELTVQFGRQRHLERAQIQTTSGRELTVLVTQVERFVRCRSDLSCDANALAQVSPDCSAQVWIEVACDLTARLETERLQGCRARKFCPQRLIPQVATQLERLAAPRDTDLSESAIATQHTSNQAVLEAILEAARERNALVEELTLPTFCSRLELIPGVLERKLRRAPTATNAIVKSELPRASNVLQRETTNRNLAQSGLTLEFWLTRQIVACRDVCQTSRLEPHVPCHDFAASQVALQQQTRGFVAQIQIARNARTLLTKDKRPRPISSANPRHNQLRPRKITTGLERTDLAPQIKPARKRMLERQIKIQVLERARASHFGIKDRCSSVHITAEGIAVRHDLHILGSSCDSRSQLEISRQHLASSLCIHAGFPVGVIDLRTDIDATTEQFGRRVRVDIQNKN